MNGMEHGRHGNHDPEMSPHSVYPASGHDQWVAIAVSNDDEWRAMCEVAGHRRMDRRSQIHRPGFTQEKRGGTRLR